MLVVSFGSIMLGTVQHVHNQKKVIFGQVLSRVDNAEPTMRWHSSGTAFLVF